MRKGPGCERVPGIGNKRGRDRCKDYFEKHLELQPVMDKERILPVR
ncbi:MAG TPA: hypothetical protein VIL05_08935 [Thermoclostridium sp.]